MIARPIEIIGGGLAGLSLGIALRRSGIPVTLFEAGEYPRHRVCGEFITGLEASTRAHLQLDRVLGEAKFHREIQWYFRDRTLHRDVLPLPAIGLSRYVLDCRLADTFVALGGELMTKTRVNPSEAPPGRVFAHGRHPSRSPWLGLKLHVRGVPLASELELHLGEEAYVGLSAVENDTVNICGLFRKRSLSTDTGEPLFLRYLRAAGLIALADRLAPLTPDAEVAVAGLAFGRAPVTHRLAIGDAFAMPPPFTGNGMAMAFQSAETALGPLLAWSKGTQEWSAVVRNVRDRLQRRFRLRLASAAMIHPFMLRRTPQRWLAAANARRLLPFRPLFHALH